MEKYQTVKKKKKYNICFFLPINFFFFSDKDEKKKKFKSINTTPSNTYNSKSSIKPKNIKNQKKTEIIKDF